MKYVVTYNKPGQIQGARTFEIEESATTLTLQAIRNCAVNTAGPGATIVSIELVEEKIDG